MNVKTTKDLLEKNVQNVTYQLIEYSNKISLFPCPSQKNKRYTHVTPGQNN